jgi:hypothetical protein
VNGPIKLSERDREFVVLFIVGFALGLLAIYLVEEWVIESDQADRRRIREELDRWAADRGDRGDELDMGGLQELTELRFAVGVYKAKLAELRGPVDPAIAELSPVDVDASAGEGETSSEHPQAQAIE